MSDLSATRLRAPRKLPSRRTTDISGKVFGHLTALERVADGKWLCECACGNRSVCSNSALRHGRIKSCGCQRYAWAYSSEQRQLLAVWRGMRQRCLSPTSKDYPRYGARGVMICERWLNSLADFCSDMGPRPSPHHSIDRIDVNGDYEPANCRWATSSIQANNTRRNPKYLIHGELLTGSEAYAKYAPPISLHAFKFRLRKGWPIERAILPPMIGGRRAASC